MMDLHGVADARVLALSLLEAAPDAILVVGASGLIVIANRMAEQLFGYPRDELIGLSVDELVPHSQREHHAAKRGLYAQQAQARSMGELASLSARRKDGSLVPVEISLSPVDSSMGSLVIAIVRDVSRRRALESELRRAGSHDALTGLHNRAFLEGARTALEADPIAVGVLIIDVDGLKRVNDACGHAAGDQLIKCAAQILTAIAGPDDLAVRIGGDEFALLVPRATAALLEGKLARLRTALAEHNAAHPDHRVAFSVGSALSEPGGSLASTMQMADQRMYEDKRRNRKVPANRPVSRASPAERRD